MPEQLKAIHIIRRPEVLKRTGLARSTLYQKINQELFVPPVSLGARAVGWIEHEVDAILLAIVAQEPEQEIRLLVRSLVVQRGLKA